MGKIALLVGVNVCDMGFPPLRKARTNVQVLKRALQGTSSGFVVQTLDDPSLLDMMEAIEQLFRHCEDTDQVLFFFSGYGIKDVDGQLYFAAPQTALDDRGNLIRSRTMPIRFLQNVMDSSPAGRQVVMFDCCFRQTGGFSTTEGEILMEDTYNHLIGDRRVILSATTSTQHLPEPDSLDAWSYTRYWAEGAATGAADIDCDGSLTVKELHYYAQRKLQVAAPDQHPQFYGSEDTANQLVLQVPSQTPPVRYRQFLEKIAQTSEIDTTELRILSGRNILNTFRQHLGLSPQEAAKIEEEVMRPFRERRERVQLYKELVSKLTQETE